MRSSAIRSIVIRLVRKPKKAGPNVPQGSVHE